LNRELFFWGQAQSAWAAVLADLSRTGWQSAPGCVSTEATPTSQPSAPGVQPDSRLSKQAYPGAVTSALGELRPSTDRTRHGRLDPAVLLQDASRLGQLG
jgi:hypothetical protein